MKLTDGKRTVEIKMQTWNGSGYDPDWSSDFFEAGSLTYQVISDMYEVANVDDCIGEAKDWANRRGDYAEDAPWEVDQERAVFVTDCKEL